MSTRYTRVSDHVVQANSTVRESKDSDRQLTEWKFDFSQVERGELEQLAVEPHGLVVKAQEMWRRSEIGLTATIDVRSDILDRQRASTKKDPRRTARSAASKMTPEEKASLIAELEQEVKQETQKEEEVVSPEKKKGGKKKAS